MPERAVVIPPGAGVRLSNVEFLGLSEHSPRFNVSVITMAPGAHGPEAHEHAAEDDAFYSVNHTFRNPLDTPTRVLNIHAPAGFDRRLLE